VVGDDVEHLPETRIREVLDQPTVPGLPAEIFVQPGVIGYVIAVRTTGCRLQVRRAVVRDAQIGEIVRDGGGIVEGETLIQLDTVGRRPHLASPLRQRKRGPPHLLLTARLGREDAWALEVAAGT
jgi:hypothetical protein